MPEIKNLHIRIKTLSTPLTTTILKQLEKATVADMEYALANNSIIGYVNPIPPMKHRIFLIENFKQEIRIIHNLAWQDTSECRCVAEYLEGKTRKFVYRKFDNVEHRERFKQILIELKSIAMETQIFIK